MSVSPQPDCIEIFDTTLRDGTQGTGISYRTLDKLRVAEKLDDFGVHYIEGGWPGAMPKDTEFFQRARTELTLRNADLVAFGATRKAGVKVGSIEELIAKLKDEAGVI